MAVVEAAVVSCVSGMGKVERGLTQAIARRDYFPHFIGREAEARKGKLPIQHHDAVRRSVICTPICAEEEEWGQIPS